MVILQAARIRLNGWQQAAVVVGSAVGAVMDPKRIILEERPRIISSKLEHIWDLPPTTFGGAYADFMRTRNFSPDDRMPVRFVEEDADELSYVVMRSREAHDIWHTLFGLNTNLTGELSLKVIEFQQMQLPVAFMSFVGASMRFEGDKFKVFYQHYFPWAFKAGLQCKDLMSIYYERHFDESLEDVRQKWGIVPVPPAPIRD
ncbi:hypothetical protein Leryth_015748 [Lithospermum erythrorhizon]|nr:hypothetical protein Leryth_015748 [Lithospermum erythrorhizon]